MLSAIVLLLTGCGSSGQKTADATTGGDIHNGIAAISRYGCGACHIIPGISGAVGRAGPPLAGMGSRVYIAGMLQNTPQNMIRWLEDPQAINSKTVMPNLGVTPKDAADIAGYLYTLK
ncbi:MAG: c-type cytochrome [Acidobacteriota bacterium]|nr:c-type cytochrome [Acidobacteriota bacterium]